jgi:hypothetical protein
LTRALSDVRRKVATANRGEIAERGQVANVADRPRAAVLKADLACGSAQTNPPGVCLIKGLVVATMATMPAEATEEVGHALSVREPYDEYRST